MSIRESFPGDRGREATQDVAAVLAAIALPPIEPFGSDSELLAGLPELPDFLGRQLSGPGAPPPLTQLGVAQCVYDAGIAGLAMVKHLEDAVAACKARLVARVASAAAVEASLLALDRWQGGVAATSAVTEIAMTLGIPELTAAALEHHSSALVTTFPQVLSGLESGELSWRHATTIHDEVSTLQQTASSTEEDAAMLEARLLELSANTTAASFAGRARRAREKMYPETLSMRTREAFTKRKISCESSSDGMSWVTMYVPTVSASALYLRCTRLARAVKAGAAQAQKAADQAGSGEDCREHRTLEQLRVDVATILLLGQELPDPSPVRHEKLPGRGGARASKSKAPTPEQALDSTGNRQEGTVLPVAGQEAVPGNGSGVMGGIVDGVADGPDAEYLQQLEVLATSKVMIDPPMPEALVLVTVPFLGLLGITDEPAELVGRDGGPMALDVARKLLKNSSTFLRVLTDPITGEQLPLEPQRYTVRAAERAVLQALAGGCYVPNCPNPIMDTDLDHLTAFEFGGQSTMANLAPTCRKHHTLRHFKDDKDRHGKRRCIDEPARNLLVLRGWTPKPTQDGRIGWIAPSGSFRPPQNADPVRPRYPKWLMKLMRKTLRSGGEP